MGEVNEKYTISLAQFLKVYDTAIQHSERYVNCLVYGRLSNIETSLSSIHSSPWNVLTKGCL